MLIEPAAKKGLTWELTTSSLLVRRFWGVCNRVGKKMRKKMVCLMSISWYSSQNVQDNLEIFWKLFRQFRHFPDNMNISQLIQNSIKILWLQFCVYTKKTFSKLCRVWEGRQRTRGHSREDPQLKCRLPHLRTKNPHFEEHSRLLFEIHKLKCRGSDLSVVEESRSDLRGSSYRKRQKRWRAYVVSLKSRRSKNSSWITRWLSGVKRQTI